jgi:ribosomal protein L17
MDDIDIDALNNMIENANQEVNCDDNCQLNKLKSAYEIAQQNRLDAPKRFEQAEKEYLKKLYGETKYSEEMKTRYSNEIERIINSKTKKFNENKNELLNLINNYNTSIIYSEKIDELYNKLNEEKKKLESDIDKYKSTNNINNRKAYYNENQINSLSKWNVLLKSTYFIIFAILAFKLIYQNKLYGNKYTWFLLIFLLLLPYLIIPIISKIIVILFDWSSNGENKSAITILKNIFNIISNELKILSGAIAYPFETVYHAIH